MAWSCAHASCASCWTRCSWPWWRDVREGHKTRCGSSAPVLASPALQKVVHVRVMISYLVSFYDFAIWITLLVGSQINNQTIKLEQHRHTHTHSNTHTHIHMSGYFDHLSSDAHFTNIQVEQGLINDTNSTSSDHINNSMIDFALQLEQLNLEENILKEFTLFQSKNMDILQDTATARSNTTSPLRQNRIQGW